MEQRRRFGRLETLQPPYHLFRRNVEDEILPYAAKHDIGVLVYGPLAHGLLGGRKASGITFAADDWRSKSPDFTGETFRRNLRAVERLRQSGLAPGIALPEPSSLDVTAAGADLHLSQDDLGDIDAILADAVPVWGPHPEGM